MISAELPWQFSPHDSAVFARRLYHVAIRQSGYQGMTFEAFAKLIDLLLFADPLRKLRHRRPGWPMRRPCVGRTGRRTSSTHAGWSSTSSTCLTRA
jgi:hypothetical protein